MKFILLVVLLAGAMLVSPARAADKGSCAEGVCVKVLGQSGKITMAAVDSADKIASNENRVTVNLDSLTELDANGFTVGNRGSVKHSIESFATQAFVFSDVKDGTLQGLRVSEFSFDTVMAGLTSALTFKVYVFLEDGSITLADEVTPVKKGNVKFSVRLSNWEFCGCVNGPADVIGQYVELALEIKGKGRAAKDAGGDITLGGDAKMKLSNKVEYDDRVEDMESGYPKYEVQGSKQQFTFRFRKFNDTALYDPTFDLGSSPPSGSPRTTAASVLLLAVAVAINKLW